MIHGLQFPEKFGQYLVALLAIAAMLGIFYINMDTVILDETAISATAQGFSEQGQFELAAEQWEIVLADQPDSALAAYRLALLSTLTQPEDSAAFFNRAARLDPAYDEPAQRMINALRLSEFTDDPAYQNIQIGQALAAEGEWLLAQETFNRATQANPLYTEAWAFLGQAQLQLGQDGYEALEEALQLDPESLAANIFMSVYWRAQGQPESALPYLETAVSLQPDNPSLLTDLGFSLAATSDIPAALEQFQRIIEIAPDDLETWMNIAQFSLEHDLQVGEIGLPAARQAVLLAPNDPAVLVLMARAYSQTGDRLVALRFFNRAIDADPDFVPAHYYLGLHYMAHDYPDLARQELQQTIDLAGDDPLGKQAENILKNFFQ